VADLDDLVTLELGELCRYRLGRGAQFPDRKAALEEFDAVRQRDRDEVIGLHAARSVRACESIRARFELAYGDLVASWRYAAG
jgi:hypothetical protein